MLESLEEMKSTNEEIKKIGKESIIRMFEEFAGEYSYEKLGIGASVLAIIMLVLYFKCRADPLLEVIETSILANIQQVRPAAPLGNATSMPNLTIHIGDHIIQHKSEMDLPDGHAPLYPSLAVSDRKIKKQVRFGSQEVSPSVESGVAKRRIDMGRRPATPHNHQDCKSSLGSCSLSTGKMSDWSLDTRERSQGDVRQ